MCDTNVVISGLVWSGPPARLIASAVTGEVQLITSKLLCGELERVLQRPKFATRFTSSGTSAAQMLAADAGLAAVVEPLPLPATSRDRDDDVVIATAIAGEAEAIVTGDDDLLALRRVGSIRMTTVGDALLRLESR